MNNVNKFNQLVNDIFDQYIKPFKYVSGEYIKKHLNVHINEIIKNNKYFNPKNVYKLINYPNKHGNWIVYENDDQINSAAYIVVENSICFINGLFRFKSGGNILLQHILNNQCYDLIYLTADWSQKESLNEYYRRKEFNLTEIICGKVHYFYKNNNLSVDELNNFLESIKNNTKFNRVVTEEISNKLIIVDIQPAYYKYINFNIDDFINYINKFNGKILYLFNGPDFGYESENDLIQWLIENGLSKDALDKILFKEKIYGYIREFSDYDEGDIQTIVKYMFDNDLCDTRDIENYNNLNLSSSHFTKLLQDQQITGFVDHDLIKQLQQFNNTTIIGGGKSECLWEIEQFLQACNITYTENIKFIYGN